MDLIPIFVGETHDDQRIVLYREDDTHFHIKIGNGPVQDVTPGAEFVITDDINSQRPVLQMQSREWTGTSVGLAEKLRDL
jgi:hypothetical protein